MSWVLGALGVIALLLAGDRRTRGAAWMLGLGNQAIWFVYGFATHQYGFVMSSVVFAVANAINLARWWRENSKATHLHEGRVLHERITEIVEEGRSDGTP